MTSMPPSTAADSSGQGTTQIQVLHSAGITRVLYAPAEANIE